MFYTNIIKTIKKISKTVADLVIDFWEGELIFKKFIKNRQKKKLFFEETYGSINLLYKALMTFFGGGEFSPSAPWIRSV